MPPKLYMTRLSPPSRAVIMTAEAINLPLELVEVDLLKSDHRKPEYLKLNPVHTVPTLDDDGVVLHDSHAIMGYLISKYAKDKSLYPEDLEKRALIDQRLHFDSGILFARYVILSIPFLLHGLKTVSEAQTAAIHDGYGFLEAFLKNSKFAAGDNLSIADFSLVTTLKNSDVFVPVDEGKYPNISAWKKRMEALPYYKINDIGGGIFRSEIEKSLSK